MNEEDYLDSRIITTSNHINDTPNSTIHNRNSMAFNPGINSGSPLSPSELSDMGTGLNNVKVQKKMRTISKDMSTF